MKQVLTLLAVLALILSIPGCDVGSGPGPTSEQLAQAQEVEQEFSPLRQEAQDFIRQHEGHTEGEIVNAVITLQGTLAAAERNVEALRNAPRDAFDDFKTSAERAVENLREDLEMARQAP